MIVYGLERIHSVNQLILCIFVKPVCKHCRQMKNRPQSTPARRKHLLVYDLGIEFLSLFVSFPSVTVVNIPLSLIVISFVCHKVAENVYTNLVYKILKDLLINNSTDYSKQIQSPSQAVSHQCCHLDLWTNEIIHLVRYYMMYMFPK